MSLKSLQILTCPRAFFRLLYYNNTVNIVLVLSTKRFYHILHFLGVASAAPSKANSLSIFDNPTIPWNASDRLSLPILSHVRHAGTSAMALNISTCPVTVTMASRLRETCNSPHHKPNRLTRDQKWRKHL